MNPFNSQTPQSPSLTHNRSNSITEQENPSLWPIDVDLSRADFTSIQATQEIRQLSGININGLSGSVSMTLPGLADIPLEQLSLALVGDTSKGYYLEVSHQQNTTVAHKHKTCCFHLRDGNILLTTKQMALLGRLFQDISEFDVDDSADQSGSIDSSIELNRDKLSASQEQLIQYLSLCETQSYIDRRLNLDSVIIFLKLAEYFDNEKIIDICKMYLFQHVNPKMVVEFPEKFEAFLVSLKDSGIGIVEDTIIDDDGFSYLLPGLLRELLIWSLPDVPLAHTNCIPLVNEDGIIEHNTNPSIDKGVIEIQSNQPLSIHHRITDQTNWIVDTPATINHFIKADALNVLEYLFSDQKTNAELIKYFKSSTDLNSDSLHINGPNNITIPCNALVSAISSSIKHPNCHYSVVKFLLHKMAYISEKETIKKSFHCISGMTLLYNALKLNSTKLVTLLSEFGMPLKNISLIKTAIDSGKIDSLKFVLSKGVSPSEGGALAYAIRKGENEMAQLLLNANAPISGDAYQYYKTPLIEAASQGDRYWLEKLISLGADINEIQRTGLDFSTRNSAIAAAIENNQLQIVKDLVTHQVKLDVVVGFRWYPICYALAQDIKINTFTYTKYLLEIDTDGFKKIDNETKTAFLRDAAMARSNVVLKEILKDPDFTSDVIKKNRSNTHGQETFTAFEIYESNSLHNQNSRGEYDPQISAALKPKYSMLEITTHKIKSLIDLFS